MRTARESSYSIEDFERLEVELVKKHGVEKQDLHQYFGDKVYVRELRIPKGRLVLGEIHKFKHVSIMLLGKMLMWTSEKGVFIINAPCITVTPAGCKRVGYALEDTIFATAHATLDYGDWEPSDQIMRATLAAKSLEEYSKFCEELSLKLLENQDAKI